MKRLIHMVNVKRNLPGIALLCLLVAISPASGASQEEANGFSLRLRTSAEDANIFTPDQPVVLKVSARNLTSENRPAELRYAIVDYYGKERCRGSKDLALPANQEVETEISVSAAGAHLQNYPGLLDFT